MKEWKTPLDIGNQSKAGTIFVQGLHGIPEYFKDKETTPEDWYWVKDLPKSDNAFIPKSVIEEIENRE